jgi:hypothetical protein
VIPQITVDAKGRITAVTNVTAASGGQVNTVGLSVPGILSPSSVGGTSADPIITLALDVQQANYVWAGPTTGADAVPFFRLLMEADIPQLSLGKITGLQDAIANKLDKELNDGEIWIGNDVNAPQMRSLTQDIEITNTGVVTIQDNVVTFSKMQEITGANTGVIPNIPGNLIGRWAAGPGDIQEVTLSGDFLLDSGTGELSLAVPVAPVLTTKGGLITYSQSVGAQVQLSAVYEGKLLMTDSSVDVGLKWVTAQGDIQVNTTSLDGTFNITANAVTLGKIQQLPAFTVIGNATSTNPATATALSKIQLTTLINQFDVSASGVVPATGPADGDSTKFLNAAGGWTVPAGGGGGSGTVTSANQYSIAYYSVNPTGTTVIGLAPQTTNGIYFLRANVTASAAVAPDWIGSTGTGSVVLATSPTLVTPTLGAALATSINGLTISTTTGTLTLANSSTLATSGAFSTTLTATATTTLTLPTTGTLATLAGTETFTNKTLNSPKIGSTGGQGHFHMHSTNSVPGGLADYITVFGDKGPNKKVGFLFETNAFESYFQFNATTASKTYTFPDLSGTVALLANPAAFTSITTGTASSVDGDVIFQNASNANTQTLRGSAVASSIVYVLPTTAPTAGQVLSAGLPAGSPLVSTLSWTTIAGGGDVVGPASAADGNFAVFDGTTGKLIKQPTAASLTTAGRATFNSGVDVGVSGTTQGSIVFRNNANAFTTTIQQANTATGNATYTWPLTTPGSAGLILQTDINGNLSWVSAGTGDMTTTTNQTVTGVKTFGIASNVGKLAIAGNTSGSIILAAPAAATGTVTFPNGNVTLAGLGTVQSFTAAQTFQNGLTVNTAGTLSVAVASTFSGATTFNVTGSNTVAQITLNGATQNYISYSTNGGNSPVSGTTFSTGTRLLFRAAATATTLSTSIGYGTNAELWLAGPAVSFHTPDNAGVTRTLGFFGITSGTGRGLTLGSADVTGGVLYMPQGVATTPTYAFFDGFPSGNVLPNATGVAGLGSGTRIVLRVPTTGYAWTIGYDGGAGIFFGSASATNNGLFRYFSENVEGIRFSTASGAGVASAILVRNTAGNLLQVVSGRITGYTAFSGATNTSTAYNTGTVTLGQLAERVAAIQASLTTHGLIGT